jgi:hypothetical protein
MVNVSSSFLLYSSTRNKYIQSIFLNIIAILGASEEAEENRKNSDVMHLLYQTLVSLAVCHLQLFQPSLA